MDKVATNFDTPLDIPTLEHLLEVAKSQARSYNSRGLIAFAAHWETILVWIAKTIWIAQGKNPYSDFGWQELTKYNK